MIDAVTGAGVLDAASEAFLLGTLVPSAVGWLEAALLVEPVVGTLRAARACGALWSNGVCTLEATTACGHAAAVPAEEEAPAPEAVAAPAAAEPGPGQAPSQEQLEALERQTNAPR